MKKYRGYPKGETLDKGRFVFEELLGGVPRVGLWSGIQRYPVRRRVFITFFPLRPDRYNPQVDARLNYDVPGIAPVLFIGYPDGQNTIEEKVGLSLVELRPDGEHLVSAGLLSPGETVRLALGMCDMIQEWAKRAVISQGLRPETVYVTGEPGKRRFAGATTRPYCLRSQVIFPYDFYDPPSADNLVALTLEDILFTTGMILWVAILGEHPYKVPGHPDTDENIWSDIRLPFTGPPELGRLFECVLVADPDRRMKAAEFRDELEKLARAWNVELPPFPPPGLHDT